MTQPEQHRERYYVWRSDDRSVETIEAKSAELAAHEFALRKKLPYNIAFVVPVADVQSFGFGIRGGGCCS